MSNSTKEKLKALYSLEVRTKKKVKVSVSKMSDEDFDNTMQLLNEKGVR